MERLQKVLAQAGIASRRAAEQIILAGRVRVDGRIVRELGTQVDPRKSRVEVDGVKIVAEKLVYIVLHKPRGVVCTLSDPEGRPTIKELIKEAGARLIPVGRLDFHTSGALLCTNDGEFAQGLAHPKRAVPKVYVAKVKGTVDDDALERFGERIEIDGRATQPAQVKRLRFEGDKTWLELTLREGRNRQVRRLGEATGFPVMRLARISHAGVSSEDLRPGQWRELTLDELVALKRDYGVPKKVRAPSIEHGKGRQERGEGPAARFDKRTPRTSPKKAAFASGVKGEHWSRETARDERLRGDRRPAALRADLPAPRGERNAGPPRRERDAGPPRGERNAGSPRGERSASLPRRERNAGSPRGERHAGPARGERPAGPARVQRASATGGGKRSDGRRERPAVARPGTPSTERASARDERRVPYSKDAVRTKLNERRDGRGSGPRRGTSR